MKLWDKGYDIDGFTESFTIGKDRELDVMLDGGKRRVRDRRGN